MPFPPDGEQHAGIAALALKSEIKTEKEIERDKDYHRFDEMVRLNCSLPSTVIVLNFADFLEYVHHDERSSYHCLHLFRLQHLSRYARLDFLKYPCNYKVSDISCTAKREF